MSTVKPKYEFFVGTREQFDYLVGVGKILDTYIIFLTDTHELYKGTNRYSADNLIIATSAPINPREEVMYCINGILKIYNATNGWIEISKSFALKIDSESDDTTVPTSKAVKDAIDEAISNLHISEIGAVSGITSTEIGTITVTKDSKATYVPIKGVVVSPSYDVDTRTLTLPVMGNDNPFQISFAEDVHITTGFYNQLNNSIQLTRSDGEIISIELPTVPTTFDVIPKETSTITISIVDGIISAEVRISKEDGNIIEVKDDGLYVSAQKQSGVSNEVIQF